MRLHLSNTAFAMLLLILTLTGFAELCLCRNSSIFGCTARERQALLTFKRSLTFLNDEASSSYNKNLLSWEGYDCCQWEGIACNKVTGHVVKLDLSDPCSAFTDLSRYEYEEGCFYVAYAEHISPSLSQLQHLSYLDLSIINIVASPFPSSFLGSMQWLRYLSLAGDGAQLISLGNLTNLHALYLSHFDVTTGDVGWLAQLSSLQCLGMEGVSLSNMAHDLFQVLNKLPSLLEIQLVSCGLGDIPVRSHLINLTNLTRVQVLNLANNDLEDPFLDDFQNMTSIRVLDISYNHLNSLDPLRNMTSIKVLHLSSNNLTSLPLWFGEFNILELCLSGNGFSGQLSNALQNMTSIRALDFSNNNLSSVPLWLSKFKNLVGLYLSDNLLYGPIPHALRNLTSLAFVDLHGNNFTLLPLWLSELKSLDRLDLSLNNFTCLEEGSLSSILINLCHLKQFRLSKSNGQGLAFQSNENLSGCTSYDLEVLDLSRNGFGGSLPSWLGQFKNLKHLLLTSNSFFGPIPSSLGSLTNLIELRLGDNMLNGSIPHNLAELVNLEYLELSSNYLDGALPQSLCKLKNLQMLHCSSNYLESIFTGDDFEACSQMMRLSYLNLSYNQITGSLPENLGDIMPKLSFLLLHNNLINGSLPRSLGKIKTLYSFDVSNNRLSGNISSTLWNISSLVWLHLNNNNFCGKLPSSLTYIAELLILDVGENQLSGVIPSWNSNTFPNLKILRMRRNMFGGSIPSSLCKFHALQILDLADNNLVGAIPHCIGNMKGMVSKDIFDRDELSDGQLWDDENVKQVIKGRELDYIKNLIYVVNLDLSNNFLHGSIPNGISYLSGLIGLNLSYNNLSGMIPEMVGNMESLESIDFSNNQLFGGIPNSMSALKWLSHLNLSYNNLSGPIPNENQFQVLNDPSSYTGNQYLCGSPLPNACPGDDSHHVPQSSDDEDKYGKKHDLDKVWFYFTVALGFATGFWGFIGVLLLKKNWRHAYFGYVDEVADKIYVVIVLKIAKLKKRVQEKL